MANILSKVTRERDVIEIKLGPRWGLFADTKPWWWGTYSWAWPWVKLQCPIGSCSYRSEPIAGYGLSMPVPDIVLPLLSESKLKRSKFASPESVKLKGEVGRLIFRVRVAKLYSHSRSSLWARDWRLLWRGLPGS